MDKGVIVEDNQKGEAEKVIEKILSEKEQ